LSGLVLTQLVRPGTPVLAGYIPGVADMRSRGYLGGAIEFGMMQAAAARVTELLKAHRPPGLPASIDGTIKSKFNIKATV
jgi:trimethylamine:corrinoid methyltransferase-like protein